MASRTDAPVHIPAPGMSGLAGMALTVVLTMCTLAGCDNADPDRMQAASPSTTSTSTATSSATSATTPSPDPYRPAYQAVADYLDTHLPDDFPDRDSYTEITTAEQDDGFEAACDLVNGVVPSEKVRATTIRTLASQFSGRRHGDRAAGEVLMETLFDGCWKSGLAAEPWVYDPSAYGKYRDLLTALHEAGFDDFIEYAEKPESIGSTCTWISGEKVGGWAYRFERRDWIKNLTKTGANEWGWTERRADTFVDVLFDACLNAGFSKPWVPTITTGVWTVGRDIPPGTYRSNGAKPHCYWAITRSGSNGQDIIANDLPSGGFPTVTLSIGQDFSTEDCGTWKKIG